MAMTCFHSMFLLLFICISMFFIFVHLHTVCMLIKIGPILENDTVSVLSMLYIALCRLIRYSEACQNLLFRLFVSMNIHIVFLGSVTLMLFCAQFRFNEKLVECCLEVVAVITAKLCTCHDSSAVVACAKICNDMMSWTKRECDI